MTSTCTVRGCIVRNNAILPEVTEITVRVTVNEAGCTVSLAKDEEVMLSVDGYMLLDMIEQTADAETNKDGMQS